MGNNKSKGISQKERDSMTLNNLEESTNELRKVIERNPNEGNFKEVLEQSEKTVNQILKRSQSKRQKHRCDNLIRNLEDLKDVGRTHDRESNLSSNAYETSSSIIVTNTNSKSSDDSHKKSRQLQRQFKEIEGETKRLAKKLNDPKIGAQELKNLDLSIRELHERIKNLDVGSLNWASDNKIQYEKILDDFKKRIADIQNKSSLGKKAVNTLELRPRRPRNQNPNQGSSKSLNYTTRPVEQGARFDKRLQNEMEIAKIASQLDQWKNETKNFKHESNGPEYNRLRGTLMKSMDVLGAIPDTKLQSTKEPIIKSIQDCLKSLNLKSIENTRNSLSKNSGTLRDVEILQFHITKIENSLRKGHVKHPNKVRDTLVDIHQKLNDILYGPELVTAKISTQNDEVFVSDVKVSRENLKTRSVADLLVVEDSSLEYQEANKDLKKNYRLSLPKIPHKYEESNFLDYPDQNLKILKNSNSTPNILETTVYVDPKDLIFGNNNRKPKRTLTESKSTSSNLHISTPMIQQADSAKIETPKPEICNMVEKPKMKQYWNELETLHKEVLKIEGDVKRFRATKDEYLYTEIDQRIIDMVITLDRLKLPSKDLLQKKHDVMMVLHKAADSLNVLSELQEIHDQLDELIVKVHKTKYNGRNDPNYRDVDDKLTYLYEQLEGLNLGLNPYGEILEFQQRAAKKIEQIAVIQGHNLDESQILGTEV